MSKQTGLDGLDVLLEVADPAATHASQAMAHGIVELSVDQLRPGRYQPRQQLSEESLIELADTIREQGVLQPLVVRAAEASSGAMGPTLYEIVAGERRWRAARLAGLATVPVVVRELSDQGALAVALIENLQREDLNPIDQARSLSRLAEEFGLTHEQVGRAVGRSRAAITNLLRLLDLDEEVKTLLATGRIDMGHARALLSLDSQRQVAMARKTEARGLSVRQVEKAVRTLLAAPAGAPQERGIDLQTLWLQHQLEQEVGQKLAIGPVKGGGYTLRVAFADLAELQQALARIQGLIVRIREAAGPRARDTRDGS